MKTESGTTMDTDLNKFFKLFGSSDRPAYPGFRVMNTAQSGLSLILVSSNKTVLDCFFRAVWIDIITWEMRDNTLVSMRLNSSKQTHEPLEEIPLKNLTTSSYS